VNAGIEAMSNVERDTPEEVGHEPLEVSARAVSIAVAVLFAGIILAIVLMGGLSAFLSLVRGGRPVVRSPGPSVELPPGVPEVDSNQIGTLSKLRVREAALLNEYAWVDRDEGVARIPVGRAMEILARRSARAPEPPDRE
jgi:hypothetical protein